MTKDYKYVVYPELESDFKEFYDRKNDPLEKRNLINEPEYAELIEQYAGKLDSMKMAVE